MRNVNRSLLGAAIAQAAMNGLPAEPVEPSGVTDTQRLYWLAKHPELIFSIGGRWYWREGYGMPHRRATSLREAIDLATRKDTP